MSAAAKLAKRVVLIGSVWKRQDPSGAWQTFEVSHISKNPFGQRCAKGRLASGTIITLNIVRMENADDPSFELVHDNYVQKAVG